MHDEAPASADEAEDRRVQQRLRSALTGALGLLCLGACVAIGTELVRHISAVLEARSALAARGGVGQVGGPLLTANVTLDRLLIIEALVLEPLFVVCIGFLIAFVTRSSYALSLGAFILYNVGAILFAIAVWGVGIGGSPQHTLTAALVCMIGLPIAEFGLWSLFRPGERERYLR